jgi:hypothetical protein
MLLDLDRAFLTVRLFASADRAHPGRTCPFRCTGECDFTLKDAGLAEAGAGTLETCVRMNRRRERVLDQGVIVCMRVVRSYDGAFGTPGQGRNR